ncbi:UNVERIFIED_ORG: SLT domain-containing protein/phage-related minor tail protein [Heyndrickxia coagulans]
MASGNKPLGNMIIGLSLDGSQFSNSLDGIKKQIKTATSAMKANLSILSESGDEYDKLSTHISDLNTIMQANQKQIDILKKKYDEAKSTYGENSKEAQNLAKTLNDAIAKQGAYAKQLDQTKSKLEDYKRGTQDLKNEIDLTEKTMNANISTLQAQGKAYQSVVANLQGLEKAHGLQQKVLSNEKAKLDELIRTKGEDAKETKIQMGVYAEAKSKLADYEKKIGDIKDTYKNISSDSAKFGDHLNDIGGKFDDTKQKATKWGGVLAKAFTAPIAAISGLSAKFSSEMSSIQGQIQAMTGKTSKEANKQGKIVGQVWADGFGESTDEVADAVIKIQQNLSGIKDSQLKSVTEKAMTLTQITGADLDESLRGVNSLMTNFGMSANDAFDYLVTGAQRGLNKSHELEDNIAEYGQLWSQNGFSAQEMFGILENGLKSGAYNFDKVNDFVKEFGVSLTDGRFEKNIGKFSSGTQELFKKFKDGKATTKDVFNSAINDLKGMKNQQDKLTIASTVWSALGEDNAMKVIESLNNTNKAYNDVRGATDKASKAMTNTPVNKFKSAWRNFQKEMKPVGDTLLNLGVSVLPKVEGMIKRVMKPFQNMSPTMQKVTIGIGLFLASLAPLLMVAGGIAGAISNISFVLGGLATRLGTTTIASTLLKGSMALLTNPIGLIIAAIAALAGGFIFAYKKIKPFHDFINKMASSLMTFIRPAIAAVTSFIKNKINEVKSFWHANGATIIQATKNVFAVIQKIVKVAMAILTPIFKVGFAVIVAIVKSVWGNIKGIISGALKIIEGVVLVFSGLFTGKWKIMWKGIKSIFSGAVQFLWNLIQVLWIGKMLKAAKAFVAPFKGIFSKLWSVLKTIFGTPIKWIVDLIKKSFGVMNKLASGFSGGFKSVLSKMWSVVKGIFTHPIETIKRLLKAGFTAMKNSAVDIFNGMKNGASKIWDKMVSSIKSLPHKMASALKNGAGKLKSAMKAIGNDMIDGLAAGVNGVGKGVNWILDKVHAPKKFRIPKWHPPHYAKGTDNHPGGLAVLSDGKGKNKQELVSLPNGQAFLSPKTETMMNLPKGTSVLNGDATAKLMSMLPRYANGTGWLAKAWDGAKNIGKNILSKGKSIWDYATNPGKLISKAIDKFTNLNKLVNPTLSLVKGMITSVKSGSINWIKKMMMSNTDNPGGSGVERWRPYVIRALEMNGLSTSKDMVAKVLRQIRTESGGNPKAVQHGYTDINTITGDLAKGLMQTISATFNAYKFKGHGNIFNGFDNLLAALNYAKHRYGKNLNGLGEGHGYANGAIVTKAQLANIAEGNKPEAIIPLTKKTRALQILSATNALLGVPNGSNVTINNDYSGIIANQDRQISLMQKQIDLLTRLLFKDQSIEVDGRELAKVTAPHMKNEIDALDNRKNRLGGVL